MGGVGSTAREGYVEGLGFNGTWGGICDDFFDINDADVICRMLGFPSAITALGSSTAMNLYGTAPSGDNFVLDELNCHGNEDSVFDCPHNGEWNEDCERDEIAGVRCSSSRLKIFSNDHFDKYKQMTLNLQNSIVSLICENCSFRAYIHLSLAWIWQGL